MPFSGIDIKASFTEGLKFDQMFGKVMKSAAKCIPNYIMLYKHCMEDSMQKEENKEINESIEGMLNDLTDQRSTMNYGRVLFFLRKVSDNVICKHGY